MAELEDFSNAEDCDRCVDCLVECAVIPLNRAEAQREIGRLIEGEESKTVLDHCSTCFACNLICTKRANPYGLILFRWFERYRREGLPQRALMALPLSPGNFFQVLMEKAPPDEQTLLREWQDLSRPELASKPQALFAGCNLKAMPYFTFSSLFADLPTFASADLCCGEVYFRMGILDKAESQAHYLEERYRALNLKRVVYFCLAGYNMMQNLLPRYFGVSFDFDKVYLLDYLWQEVERGEIKIRHRASCTVTVQDPCHAKTLGQDFMNTPRCLLEEMGYSLLEMEHNRELALCCGFGNGAGRYSPVDIVASSLRRLGEARKTGAQMVVTYCSVCQLYLSLARKFYPKAPPVYHVLDLLQMAIGEQPAMRHSERANKMLRFMTFGLPGMASPRRTWVKT